MNPEIKEKWINALLSGEYKQVNGMLRSGDKYCCLGVLCDIHSKETGTQWSKTESYMGSPDYLPYEVEKWAGLSNFAGMYDDRESLAHDNDTGKSFAEIAEIIREKF